MKKIALILSFVFSTAAIAQERPSHTNGDAIPNESRKLASILFGQRKALAPLLEANGLDEKLSFSRGAVTTELVENGEKTTYQLEVRKCAYSIRNAKCERVGTLTIEETPRKKDEDKPNDYRDRWTTNYTFKLEKDKAKIFGAALLPETLEIGSIVVANRELLTQKVLSEEISFINCGVSESDNGDRLYEFLLTNVPYTPKGEGIWSATMKLKYDASSKTFSVTYLESGLG